MISFALRFRSDLLSDPAPFTGQIFTRLSQQRIPCEALGRLQDAG